MAISFEPYYLMNMLLEDICSHTRQHDIPLKNIPAEYRRIFAPIDSPVSLPALLRDTVSLELALRRRTAVRNYGDSSISLASVGTILAAVEVSDQRDWRDEREAGVNLDLLLLNWRIDDLPPAVYQYLSGPHQLLPIGPAPTPDEAELLIRQQEFAQAGALLLISGNLAAAVWRHGSHGYRQILLRAGAAVQCAWLASLSLGLVGCPFEGLLPNALHELVRTDGYTQASLFAFAIGNPLGSEQG